MKRISLGKKLLLFSNIYYILFYTLVAVLLISTRMVATRWTNNEINADSLIEVRSINWICSFFARVFKTV